MVKSKRQKTPPRMTKHHRKPKALGGADEDRNISWLPRKKHTAFHTLFGTDTPEEIARMLTRKYIDPDCIMIAVPKEFWEELMRRVAKKGGCNEIKRTLRFIDQSTRS